MRQRAIIEFEGRSRDPWYRHYKGHDVYRYAWNWGTETHIYKWSPELCACGNRFTLCHPEA